MKRKSKWLIINKLFIGKNKKIVNLRAERFKLDSFQARESLYRFSVAVLFGEQAVLGGVL